MAAQLKITNNHIISYFFKLTTKRNVQQTIGFKGSYVHALTISLSVYQSTQYFCSACLAVMSDEVKICAQ